jgi:hypothetical protein
LRLLRRSLGPHKASLLGTNTLLNELAGHEALPEVTQEVGLLLDVLLSKERGNGPGSFLCVVERNAAREC